MHEPPHCCVSFKLRKKVRINCSTVSASKTNSPSATINVTKVLREKLKKRVCMDISDEKVKSMNDFSELLR